MSNHGLRRSLVGIVFVAAVGLAFVLNRAGGGAPAPEDLGFSFEEVARSVGLAFVHHGPTLDPKVDNIAPHVAALGVSVSVTDANQDGWPDLYFTNSRFGTPNALYLNQGTGPAAIRLALENRGTLRTAALP